MVEFSLSTFMRHLIRRPSADATTGTGALESPGGDRDDHANGHEPTGPRIRGWLYQRHCHKPSRWHR